MRRADARYVERAGNHGVEPPTAGPAVGTATMGAWRHSSRWQITTARGRVHPTASDLHASVIDAVRDARRALCKAPMLVPASLQGRGLVTNLALGDAGIAAVGWQ